MEAIKSRRSIRKYTDKAVSRDMIEDIVSGAILSPSAKNRQPWKFIVYTDTKKNEILDVMEQALVKEKETHALLPESSGGLADAFNTLKIMREAPVLFMIMNTNGLSPYEAISTDDRITEICDTLSLGAAIENMLLRATELGLGTLWIANTCFAYTDLVSAIGEAGQLVGAVSLGYADETPATRPRKKLEDVLEFR